MLSMKRLPLSMKRINWSGIVLFVMMGLFALAMASPVLWMLSASFQNQADVFKAPFNWLPGHLDITNYAKAWNDGNLGSAFLTSVEVTLLYLPIHVFFSTLTGYVFAKFNFRGKNVIFLLILATMLIPQETTYFSVYDITRSIGWLNTPQGVVLPFVYSGFGIFLMRQYALAIPDELIEAARVDGCSNIRCFFSIAMPLLRAGMTALAILALTFIWNEFAWSRLVLSEPTTQTLPVALYFLSHVASGVGQVVQYPVLLAASVIAAAPVLILFFLFQRHFIESISKAGLTG